MENRRPIIYIYTDGASSGNPGPGGYGVVMKCAGLEKEMSGGFIRTTNNRMELLAVIKGLEAIKWKNAEVEIWSDSSYVVKAINEGWLRKWEAFSDDLQAAPRNIPLAQRTCRAPGKREMRRIGGRCRRRSIFPW